MKTLEFLIDISEDDDMSEDHRIPTGTLARYLQVPTAFTGTAIGIQTSFDGGATWVDVATESGAPAPVGVGAEAGEPAPYAILVAAGRSLPSYIPLPVAIVRGLDRIRFFSNAAETADRILTLHVLDSPIHLM